MPTPHISPYVTTSIPTLRAKPLSIVPAPKSTAPIIARGFGPILSSMAPPNSTMKGTTALYTVNTMDRSPAVSAVPRRAFMCSARGDENTLQAYIDPIQRLIMQLETSTSHRFFVRFNLLSLPLRRRCAAISPLSLAETYPPRNTSPAGFGATILNAELQKTQLSKGSPW